MLAQEIFTGLVMFISPLVPPILVPLAFSMIAFLMYQKANPREVSGLMIASSMLACIAIRIIEGYIVQKMREHKLKHKKPDPITLRSQKFLSFFIKEDQGNKISQRVEGYVKTKRGRVILFLLAIFCTAPTVPDIITVRIFRYKMKVVPFLIAAFIGKIISFVPFVFLGKGILQLLGI